jgi:hypothetical protein
VRTPKECEQVRGTHSLSGAEGRIDQDTKRKLASEGRSLPAKVGWRDNSGHQSEPVSEGHSPTVESEKSGRQKRASAQGVLTLCQGQSDG